MAQTDPDGLSQDEPSSNRLKWAKWVQIGSNRIQSGGKQGQNDTVAQDEGQISDMHLVFDLTFGLETFISNTD